MIVTDAWFPQTNGVVSTLAQTAAWLGRFGHEMRMLTPKEFRSVACPTYPEIRLSLFPYKKIEKDIRAFAPQALHIATEGPLGLERAALLPEVGCPLHDLVSHAVSAVFACAISSPLEVSYAALLALSRLGRALHGEHGFDAQGIDGAGLWRIWRTGNEASTPINSGRGQRVFSIYRAPLLPMSDASPSKRTSMPFFSMPWAGSKIVIGDGPERARLQQQYPDATFTGYKFGDELATPARRRRRHGLPEPNRYFRTRQSRGDGLRCAGCRLSGDGPHRCDRRRRHGRVGQ